MALQNQEWSSVQRGQGRLARAVHSDEHKLAGGEVIRNCWSNSPIGTPVGRRVDLYGVLELLEKILVGGLGVCPKITREYWWNSESLLEASNRVSFTWGGAKTQQDEGKLG